MKENVFVTTQTLTPGGVVRFSDTVRLFEDRDIVWSSAAVGTVLFGPTKSPDPARRLDVVDGRLTLDGVTVGPQFASTGWGGIEVAPGAALALHSAIIDGPLAAGASGAVRTDLTFETTHAVPTGHTWTLDAVDADFGASARLDVFGTLDADGVTLTASDPAAGWRGMRFLSGSSSTVENSVLTRVGGQGTYAVRVENASVSFDDVRIAEPAASSQVGGVLVRGGVGTKNFHLLRVENHPYAGVIVTDQANIRMTESIATDSNLGLVVSYEGHAFLHPALDGARILGNQFLTNATHGVRALQRGGATFGYSGTPVSGIHNDGFNTVTGSGGAGLAATTDAILFAGSSSAGHARNRLFGNTGLDANAGGAGTSVYARCDWWNDITPPFRTGTTGGATLDDSQWLVADPYVDPSATCVSSPPMGSTSARTAGASDVRSRRDRLDAALGQQDKPALALATLASILTDAPASPEAASALSLTSVLAQREAPGARAMVEAHAARSGPLRGIARRALVGLDHGRGDLPSALARADALLATPDSPTDVLYAHTARVSLLDALGRTGEAQDAARALEVAAPGSLEARLARDLLGMPYLDTEPARARLAPDDAGAASMEVAALYPNPATSQATVSFSLADAATVEVTVHDVLGRRVIQHRGEHPAGPGRASVDVSALAPGAYLVRVTAGGLAETRTLTVIR